MVSSPNDTTVFIRIISVSNVAVLVVHRPNAIKRRSARHYHVMAAKHKVRSVQWTSEVEKNYK